MATCENHPTALCEIIAGTSWPDWTAEFADALMGRPLRLGAILLVAWVSHLLIRRHLAKALARWEQAQPASPTRGTGPSEDRLVARRRALAQVVVGGVRVVLAVVVGFLVLDELGVELAPLLASAGVVGIAIGFGAQSLVKDFFSGFFLLAEDQLGVGDTVDLGEATGVVEAVSLRLTRVRDISGAVWHVPNGEIRRVLNRSQHWARAVIDVIIAPEADVRRATEVIAEVLDTFGRDVAWRGGGVTSDPEVLGVEHLGLGGTTIRALVTTTPARQFAVAREVRLRIKEALDAAGIPTAQTRYGAGETP